MTIVLKSITPHPAYDKQGLFSSLRCPNVDSCTRNPCPFSHEPAYRLPKTESFVDKLAPRPSVKKPPTAASSSSASNSMARVIEPTKPNRPSTAAASASSSANGAERKTSLKRAAPDSSSSPATDSTSQPPRKVQKITAVTPTGAPKIQATYLTSSKVAIADRQKLLTHMYDTFRSLYTSLLVLDPSLPARHALAQEQEIYDKCVKVTYRNAMIQCIAGIKKRPHPDKIAHPSVGTTSEVAQRVAKASTMEGFKLEPWHLESLLLTQDEMQQWDYVVDIPDGVGGDKPSELGSAMKCDRCGSQYVVSTEPSSTECVYHWGRLFGQKVNGVRETIYRCCSLPNGSPGCSKGSHVFYEKIPSALHSRHAFSSSVATCTAPGGKGTLDVCAMDCEMIYTTAGMSVARVSGVDHTGKEVFDHLVKMSEGVDVVDYNTRFSGITSLEDATMDLHEIRKSLGELIGPNTILVGHALENDLKTLRILHSRVVDTCKLFPHKAGPPYRRALRELAREFLGQSIQAGDGTTGHSSLEDARATLNLVRAYVIENPEVRERKRPTSSKK